MILDINQYGDAVLRKKCRKVEKVTDEIRELAVDMIETMEDAHGVGLAAPQIGLDLRLAVVDVSHDPDSVSYLRVDGEDVDLKDFMPLVFINPELEFGREKESVREGAHLAGLEGTRKALSPGPDGTSDVLTAKLTGLKMPLGAPTSS